MPRTVCKCRPSREKPIRFRLTAALVAVLITASCTPITMLNLHRHNNPDGPYRIEVCQSPQETQNGRWWCAPDKVRQLRREAARMATAVRQWLASQQCAPGNPDGCAAMIRRIFTARGLDGEAAVRVASCESGLDPSAYNPSGASGLFQQMASYWPERAATYGVAGRSVFDGEANAIVSAGMVASSGWSAWVCQP